MNQVKNDVPIHMILWIALLIAGLFFAGCSHQAQFAAAGKVFRIGNESANIMYVNGLVAFNGTRENAESVFETNDNDAVGDPADVKTVRTIRFRTGPIVSGYAVDLAKVSPEAATEYVKIMPELNKANMEPVKTEPAKESSSIAQPILAKIKEAMGGGEAKVIVGDGSYTGLAKDRSIKYQAALCTELLTYADDDTQMPSSGESIKSSLIHFAGRLGQLTAKNKTETKMRISKATIQDGRLVYLIYLLERPEGNDEEVECPSCYEVED